MPRHKTSDISVGLLLLPPKNSLMQSIQLSFFSVNNPWLERTVFPTYIQDSPALCATSLDSLLQAFAVLRVETSSPCVWTSQEHFVTNVSLLAAAHPQKEDSSASSSRHRQVAIRLPKNGVFFPDYKTAHPLVSHRMSSLAMVSHWWHWGH